jgi:hypothetical protein
MIAATLSPRLTAAIGAAVAGAGGSDTDAEDLRDTWRRVSIDTERRADAIRGAVARARCRCADGGDPNGERCTRCHGLRSREAR